MSKGKYNMERDTFAEMSAKQTQMTAPEKPTTLPSIKVQKFSEKK